MFHTKRTKFCVVPYTDLEQLTRTLTGMIYTLCSGFEYGGFYLLNDSISESGAQEYAVIRKSDMKQLESITVSFMEHQKLYKLIDEWCRHINETTYWPHQLEIQPLAITMSTDDGGAAHRCAHCE